MGPLGKNLVGKQVKIIMFGTEQVFYKHRVEAIVVDINGLPLAVKMASGALFNWNAIAALIPTTVVETDPPTVMLNPSYTVP